VTAGDPELTTMDQLQPGDLAAFVGRPDEALDEGPWYPVLAVDADEWTWDAAAESDPYPWPVSLPRSDRRHVRRIPRGRRSPSRLAGTARDWFWMSLTRCNAMLS